MSSFVDAMSATLTKSGVKGSDVYTEDGVGDLRVALFTSLVRGLSSNDLVNTINKIIKRPGVTSEEICDLFVMAFQTRDIRGGKGERDISYHMFSWLLHEFPEMITPCIELIPEYGCWKDLWSLWSAVSSEVQKAITDVVVTQFRKDWVELDINGEKAKLSLLAKWMPRENGHYDALSLEFAKALFPSIENIDDKRRAYRKACSELTAALKVCEVNMCNGTWREIEPSKVPGRLLKKCNAAFLNQKAKHVWVPGKVEERRNGYKLHLNGKLCARRCVGTRFPDNEDRVKCAENFEKFLADCAAGRQTAKGANVVYPHEIVTSIECTSDKLQEGLLEAQWKSIRDDVVKQGGLKGVVPLCDFSGSMGGIPMQVAAALGILISEINDPAFKDHILGFDTNPQWIKFTPEMTLKEKIYHAKSSPWGGSTDFQKACDMVLERLVHFKVRPEDSPKDLLVITDMGFDAACGIGSGYGYVAKTNPWQTHIQMIRGAFKSHGYEAPRIIIWNVRAEYKDYHAQAHEEGVVMLSGWSPAILKAIMKAGVEVNTPYDGLRELLDDTRYDKVRSAFNATKTA
jgi:hypothetical protein